MRRWAKTHSIFLVDEIHLISMPAMRFMTLLLFIRLNFALKSTIKKFLLGDWKLAAELMLSLKQYYWRWTNKDSATITIIQMKWSKTTSTFFDLTFQEICMRIQDIIQFMSVLMKNCEEIRKIDDMKKLIDSSGFKVNVISNHWFGKKHEHSL